MLLGRCEFGKDDYSLNIINLPNDTPAQAEDTIQQVETVEAVVKKVTTKAKKKKEVRNNQNCLKITIQPI